MSLLPPHSVGTRRSPRIKSSTPSPTPTRALTGTSPAHRRAPGWSSSFSGIRSVKTPTVAHYPTDGSLNDAALDVFFTPELLKMILSMSDWHTVQMVSRTSQYGRHSAQSAVRSLMQELLAPFIPKDDFLDFLRMMDTTGTGIMGSVARRLIYANSQFHLQALVDGEKRFLQSKDLNLVVPNGRLETVKAWFLAHGVASFAQEGVQLPYTTVVRAVYRGTRPRIGDTPAAKIVLSHSEKDIFQVVVASPYTAQANVITSTRVYCVYPHLATSRHALRSNWPDVKGVIRQVPCTFESRSDNSMWKEKGGCRMYCPSMQRISVGDPITASFLWNARYVLPPSRFKHTDSLLASSVLSWRLSARCRNPRCKRYEPAP